MSIGSIRVPSLGEFRKDTRLILISSGIICVGFFGIQQLLKVLYVLRLGYGLQYVGVFTATPALMFMTMSMPSGWLGTRLGLKRTMMSGIVLTTFGMAALPMTELMPSPLQYIWPILTQMLLTFGWAMYYINIVPALMAATTEDTRDDAYALMSMLRGAGTFFGTIVGGLLPAMFALMFGLSTSSPIPYRWALFLSAGFGAIALLPMLRVRIEDRLTVEVESQPHGSFPLIIVAVASVHVILVNAGFAVNQSFGAAYLDTDLSLSTANIGFITAAGQFLAILAPIAMPYLGARRGHDWTLMMTGIVSMLLLLPLALINTWQAASIGRMGLLALVGLWMPALQVFQMTVIEKHWRSLAYGAVSTAMGFSYGSISLVGGFIAASMGYSALFSLGAVLAVAGSIVMWAARKVPSLQRRIEPVRTETPVIATKSSVEAS